MPVISLGETPLANAWLTPDLATQREPRYPLHVLRCTRCALVQLSVVVEPSTLFGHYSYLTSASRPMVEHFGRYAHSLSERFALKGRLVVEFGSNDGALLRAFANQGARVMGVEPASNLAAAANAEGLPTFNAFFNAGVARDIKAKHGDAAVIAANNVLAHIDDLGDVLTAVELLLAPDGVFVAEVPYLLDLLEHVEYDTIYHEHLSYFALTPLVRLFAGAGLILADVERQKVHGGTIRVFVTRAGQPSTRVEAAIDHEKQIGVTEAGLYTTFASRVVQSRDALVAVLSGQRRNNARVVGLGATAKSTTLLNYCAIGPQHLDYIADSTHLKVGLLSPGSHIPIRSEDALSQDRPDTILLLAWNYADQIIAKHSDYLAGGGRFIHPIPLARLIP